MPQRAISMSKPSPISSMTAAVLAQCHKPRFKPYFLHSSLKYLNLSSASLAPDLSVSSAVAKCVNTPVISILRSPLIFLIVSAPDSSGLKPMRDIPVSTAICILAVLPKSPAHLSSALALSRSNTVSVMSSVIAVSKSSASAAPSKSIGLRIPFFLSSAPSSMQATPR